MEMCFLFFCHVMNNNTFEESKRKQVYHDDVVVATAEVVVEGRGE